VKTPAKFITGLLALALLATPTLGFSAESDNNLTDVITAYLSDQPGDYSVTAIELGGARREVHLNDRNSVDPASIFKLYYAQFALEKVQQGKWSLNTRLKSNYTVSTCLKLMISYSDNECAADFREKLGSKYVNSRLSSLGLSESRILLDSRGNYKTKRTSTADVARFLEMLDRGQLLGAEQTTRLRNHLKAQIWRARISSALQAGTQVASKSGQLLTKSGMIEADSAIIYGPRSNYILVVIGRNGASGSVVRSISELVYRSWQGPITTASNYPKAQLVTISKSNLRSTPGGRVIKTVPGNSAVTVDWNSRGWVYVKVGSRNGYIYHNNLRLSDRYLQWGIR
jgi:beta-lactamase class A